MNKEQTIIFSIFNIIFLLILIYFVDLQLSPDSRTYINSAKIIKSPHDLLSIQGPEYIVTYLIFKFFLMFDNFLNFFKIFNYISFILIVFISFKILSHFEIKLKKKICFLYFIILYYFSFEILQWTSYALIDLFLISLILLSSYLFLKNFFFLSLAIVLFSLFIKPQSIFLIFIISYILVYKKTKSNLVFIVLYLLFYLFIIGLTYIAKQIGISLHVFDVLYEIFFVKLQKGVIVDDRIFLNNENFLSILQIYFLRLINIFSIYFDTYSLKHKIYNIFYFVILYFPIILFFLTNTSKSSIFPKFSICIIFIIVLFLTLTFIDYDLRYRLYFLPFLIMLSTFCFNKLYNNYILKKNLIKSLNN